VTSALERGTALPAPLNVYELVLRKEAP
jgi:hypothetical protein